MNNDNVPIEDLGGTCHPVAEVMELDSAGLPDGMKWMSYVCSECGGDMSPCDARCGHCGRKVDDDRRQ